MMGAQPEAAADGIIDLPADGLVVLVGPSGCGKTTFARRHFRSTEILSSDAFRAMVSDDENDQTATPDAFGLLHLALDRRLKRRRLTVIDATNLKREDRLAMTAIARVRQAPFTAIVFDLSPAVLEARRLTRTDRRLPSDVLPRQIDRLRRAMAELPAEGFERVYTLRSEAAVTAARVERLGVDAPRGERGPRYRPNRKESGDVRGLPGGDNAIDRRRDAGPFDLIGDVHGCIDELAELLGLLGYRVDLDRADSRAVDGVRVEAPNGRKAILLGDLVDRGPATPAVLRVAMAMTGSGAGLAILGNHDWKLLRAMWGRNVRVSHGLGDSLAQLGGERAEFRARVQRFLETLPAQLLLDGGRLVVAHAGVTEPLQGQTSKRAREFALYGETTGEIDEFGLPVRINWAKRYRGAATVVYGHTPVRELEWVNYTIDIDTGCVFGGRLTALRWPERELVSVPAARVYYETQRPILESVDHRDYLGGRPDDAMPDEATGVE